MIAQALRIFILTTSQHKLFNKNEPAWARAPEANFGGALAHGPWAYFRPMGTILNMLFPNVHFSYILFMHFSFMFWFLGLGWAWG